MIPPDFHHGARRTVSSAVMSLVLATVAVALAGTPRTWSGEIDGVAAWVTVVPRNGEIAADAGPSWTTWGDAVDDAYLFAFGERDRVRLALEFAPRGEGAEVRVRAERPGEGPVAFSLQDDRLAFERPPLYRLWTESGPWVENGLPNYDLRFEVDGREGKEPGPVDGIADHAGRVAEAEPGVPDWQVSRMVNDPHPSWGYPRFSFAKRMEDAPPFVLETPIWPEFPFLGISQRPGSWFESNLPPLYFRLDRNEFDTNSFVGFHFGGMYQIGSIAPPPNVNFESPYAFYRLDPENDGRSPDLVVRAGGRSPAYDRFSDAYGRGVEETDFRYSWKTFDRSRWNYSLNVSGNVGYPELQSFGNGAVEFYAPDPETLPSWVADRKWGVATFVEATETFSGAEGLYFYTAQARPVRMWRLGASAEAPEFFEHPYLPRDTSLWSAPDESLPPGFRGEYASALQRVPELYLSPVDNRLHLRHADGGVWHVSPGLVLRSRDADGDGRQDVWTLERVSLEVPVDPAAETATSSTAAPSGEGVFEDDGASFGDGSDPSEEVAPLPRAENGEALARLRVLGNVLVLEHLSSDAPLVRIKQLATPIVDAPVPVPEDAATWTTQRDLLASVRGAERDPLDLASWYAAFEGAEVVLDGARVEGAAFLPDEGTAQVRVDATGLASAPVDFFGTYTLQTGRFAATLRRDGWEVAPLLDDLEIEIDASGVAVNRSNAMTLTLINPGTTLRSGPARLLLGDEEIASWDRILLRPAGEISLPFAWIGRDVTDVDATLVFDGRAWEVDPSPFMDPRRPPDLDLASGLWVTLDRDLRLIASLSLALSMIVVVFWRMRRVL